MDITVPTDLMMKKKASEKINKYSDLVVDLLGKVPKGDWRIWRSKVESRVSTPQQC